MKLYLRNVIRLELLFENALYTSPWKFLRRLIITQRSDTHNTICRMKWTYSVMPHPPRTTLESEGSRTHYPRKALQTCTRELRAGTALKGNRHLRLCFEAGEAKLLPHKHKVSPQLCNSNTSFPLQEREIIKYKANKGNRRYDIVKGEQYSTQHCYSHSELNNIPDIHCSSPLHWMVWINTKIALY